ncbi:MAG: laccase domain-containing protein, partial [Alphaproteobacteria bacterium]|nr:laccase domain-containing protein [Alphaproteobacteria bacterium]
GKPGHVHFNLEAYVAHRLEAAGVGNITKLGEDTSSQPERYFSYRRATLNSEPDYGRQISVIGLPTR